MSERVCYYCKSRVWLKQYENCRITPPRRVILPVCCNHEASPGVIREVHPLTPACRNFQPQTEHGTPPLPTDPNVRYIPLTKGLYAIVDAADYERLSKYTWFAMDGRNGKFYAGRKKGRSIIPMHRDIMKPPRGMVVHHINANGLDNRRCNLVVCSPEHNHRCRQPGATASGLVGVYPYGKRWRALITHKGESLYEEVFDDKIEAAKTRDRKALELLGPAAFLNFPDRQEPTATGHANPTERPVRYIACRGSITARTFASATLWCRTPRKRPRVATAQFPVSEATGLTGSPAAGNLTHRM